MKHAMVLMLVAVVLTGVAFATVPPDKPGKTKPKAEVDFKNPVRKISAMMKKAGKLLDQLETGDPTQDEQKKILEELDKLIEMAEKSSSSSSQQQQQRDRNKTKNAKQQPQNSGGKGSPDWAPAPRMRGRCGASCRKRPATKSCNCSTRSCR